MSTKKKWKIGVLANGLPIQLLVDSMSAQWKRERAETQMTLGKLIAVLEGMEPMTVLPGLRNAHSYRGYYSDLAFEEGGENTAALLLEHCREAMGREFGGYKGGDYLMGENTPVWVAHYGCCGLKLIGISAAGLETKEDEL